MVEQQKSHRRGNTKSSRWSYNTHQNKMGPKHSSNSVPPLTVPPPYHPPVGTPFFHPMVPVPSVPAPGYVHQFPRGIFPRPDARLAKSGGDHGGTKEQHVQMTSPWNNQMLVAPNNFPFLQTLEPRPYMRPHFFSPTGFVEGPKFPGPVCYIPYPPPGSVRVPYPPAALAPQPLYPGVPMSPSPTMVLRTRLSRQIEYYFSDRNLRFDNYLKSCMDNQGWVPISIIADFQRVKQMNAEIPFILDALQASETIEVQDEKVRRRHDWSQWNQAPVSKSSSLVRNNGNNDVCDENKRDGCEGKRECPSPKRSSEGHHAEQVKDRILSSDEAPTVASGNSNSSMALRLQPDVDDATQLDSESNCKSIFLENCESGMMHVLPNLNVKNLDDPTNDFSSTLKLDEELELEQTTIRAKIAKGSTKVHKSVHYPLELLDGRELRSPSFEGESELVVCFSEYMRGVDDLPISTQPLPWFLIISPEHSEFFSPLTRETRRTTTSINTSIDTTWSNFEVAGQSTPYFQPGNWFLLFERRQGRVILFNGEQSVELPNLRHVPIEGIVIGGYHGNPLVDGDYQVVIVNSRIPVKFTSIFYSSHPEDGWKYYFTKFDDDVPEKPMGPLTHSNGFSYIDRIHQYLVNYNNFWDSENLERGSIKIDNYLRDEGDALDGVDMICLYSREGERFGMVTHTNYRDPDTRRRWDRYDIYKFSEVIPDLPLPRIALCLHQILPTENLFASPYGPGTLTRLPMDHRIGLRQNLFLGGFGVDCRRFIGGMIPMLQDQEILKPCSHTFLSRCRCRCRAYVVVTDFGG